MMLPSAEDIKLHREAQLVEKVMVWLRRGTLQSGAGDRGTAA